MQTDVLDLELYELLLVFAQISSKLNEDGADHDELLSARRELATQLRQRGFMISEEQQQRLCTRLHH